MKPLRPRQRFGKFIIEKRLAEGGFANIYQALDTIEGVRVALKVPYRHLISDETIEWFKREARLVAKLEHPNILPVKNADFIDHHFVVVTPLGEMSLEDRLQKRLAVATAIDFSSQMLSAVAFAHEHRIIHCDIKPDNFIIFPGNRIRLIDFGIARVAQRTLKGSGAGTVGYVAPEQAMGKPSFRSDVFSLGLVFYRMFSGYLPEWPFQWPPVGHDRLRRKIHPELISLIQKAIEVNPRKRFRDAQQMQSAFHRIRQPQLTNVSGTTKARRRSKTDDWQTVRRREFRRLFGKQLETKSVCSSCSGPVSEAMQSCPWCGKPRRVHDGETRFPVQCPRCYRGLKADWHYCPWCYGAGFDVKSNRQYSDRRYTSRCDNKKCSRRSLMPFMRYCPWCRRRVRKKWQIDGSRKKCSRCGWGVLQQYWTYCPWCGQRIS